MITRFQQRIFKRLFCLHKTIRLGVNQLQQLPQSGGMVSLFRHTLPHKKRCVS